MNNTFGKLLFVYVGISITACSTIKTDELTKNESKMLENKSLVYTQYKKPPNFQARTAANVQFGLIGLSVAIEAGNDMIKNNKVEDPAFEIANLLGEALKSNHNVNVIYNNTLTKSYRIKDLVSLYKESDYILDVRTLDWGSIYYMSDWNNYRIFYNVHARLIDRKTKKILAEEVCSNTPEYKNSNLGPSYEDLENGDSIKLELAKSVKFCVEHILTMTKFHDKKELL